MILASKALSHPVEISTMPIAGKLPYDLHVAHDGHGETPTMTCVLHPSIKVCVVVTVLCGFAVVVQAAVGSMHE